LFTKIGRIKPVYEVVWCCSLWTQSGEFPFSRCIDSKFFFRKAWLRDWFSTCLNLVTPLQCCSDLQLLTHFLS